MAYIGYQPPERFNSAFKKEDFTGNGTQGPFVLELAVVDGSEQGIEVFVDDVRQEPTEAYTVGGSGGSLNKEILFTVAPGVGADIYVIHKGDTTLAIAVGDNSVTDLKLADDAVTSNKILDGSVTSNKILDGSVTPQKTSFLKSNTDNSAIFEVSDSTSKGTVLAPKMTQAQRDAIVNPTTALVIYNTTDNKLNIYNGTQWEELGGGGVSDGPQSEVNAADIFTNFVKDMEDHGRNSLHTEAGFVDEFESSNDMIDEANSSGFTYDETDDFYSNIQLNQTSSIDFTTETNYIQQEWTNSNQSTSQATVASGTTVTLSSGTWPTNCDNGRISFDSGSTWFDISSRDSNTQLTLGSSATNGTFDYIIRLSEFDSGKIELNTIAGASTNTTLLLHMDGTDGSTNFIDSSPAGRNVTAAGVVEIDTAQKQFGTGSMLSVNAGSNSRLHLLDDPAWDFVQGTGDYTIDFWWRTATLVSSTFYSQGSNNTPSSSFVRFFYDHSSSNITWTVNIGGTQQVSLSGSGQPTINTWHHYAVVKFGNVYTIYKDGTSIATTTSSNTSGTSISGNICIGADNWSGANAVDGHLDEFRIIPMAFYTSNFTPSSTAHSSVFTPEVYPKDEYISIVTTESFNTDITGWVDIKSASSTEVTNGNSNAHYWLGFDPASGYGAGTEAKIYQFSNDKLLMNFNNNLNDESSNISASNWTTGDVAFSSGVTKFGSHSLEFSSGGGNAERFLYNTNSTSLADDILNSPTWTVEYWYRQDFTPDPADTNPIITIAPEGVWLDNTPRGITFELGGTNNIFYVYTSGTTAGSEQDNLQATGISPTANTWIHYAVTFENGNLIKLYVDGVLKVSRTIDPFTGTSTNAKFQFGERGVNNLHTIFGNNNVAGKKIYIDDFRASTDLKYASNFTPPTSEFVATSSGWKTIAKNNAGTWEYNTNESLTYTGTTSTTNDMLHAVSQAIQSHSFNRMNKTNLELIADADFETTNGFDLGTHTSLFRGVTLFTDDIDNNISIDNYSFVHDDNKLFELRTKQWTGTGGTPSTPSSSPDKIYLFVVDEHLIGSPQYLVTRDGTNYINVTFDSEWRFDGTKRARRATIDVSSQSAGTDPRTKISVSAGNTFKLHAIGLQIKK